MKRLIKNRNGGFSTIEIGIAMAILVLACSGVIMVISGNQSILVDGQTNSEALTLAQEQLENMQALARKDFRLVNATTSTDNIYQKTITVEKALSPFIKKVTSTISWNPSGARPQTLSLSTLITNFENAVGGDTCDSTFSGDWKNPQITTVDLGSGHPISDVEAYQGRLYVTAESSADSTFFIYDISNSGSPVSFGTGLDNSSVSAGLNALAIATSSTGNFAYVANSYGASFATCPAAPYNPPTPGNCAQLQVIDVTNPANPIVTLNYQIPTTSPSFVLGNSGSAVGKSIFYKNGYIYLGLTKTTSGPEFNIIDVHERPINPRWVGGFGVGNAVNAIYVKDNFAYLATPNTNELIVLNISNPSNPVQVSTFDAPGGSGNGRSLDVVGDTLYLGRTLGGNEFYKIDVKNPTIPVSLGQKDISSSVNALKIRDYLAFLVTTSGKLEIWNIADSSNIFPWTPSENSSEFKSLSGGSITSLDCEGNTLYAGSLGGIISVINSD